MKERTKIMGTIITLEIIFAIIGIIEYKINIPITIIIMILFTLMANWLIKDKVKEE